MRLLLVTLALFVLASAEYYMDSLGTLTTDEFVQLSSDESHRPLLVAFISPACKKCEDYYYPMIQALHAFRGTDMVVATMNTADAEGHLGDCDINMEAERPEFRFYKPNTGLEWVARELKVKMRPSRWTELTDKTFYKFVNHPRKTSIIEVYAPRCISCQNQYNDLERIMVAFDSEPVQFGKINSDQYIRFCSQWNITTLPHFMHFIDGKTYTDVQPTVQGDTAMLDYFNGLIGSGREIDGKIKDRFGLERNITRQLDRFMNGDRSAKEMVMEDVRSHLKEYQNAKMYLHVMKKVVEQGKGFLAQERTKRMKEIREMGVFAKKSGFLEFQ
ncbi:uncharacterized protein [Blastocystis hominis]|uniref:protein disulfide-isomerase n=1 Tax=Blastocystis hominis TaxID=12968 RepID=D8M3U3_BLAHO|nr:uncharacterized protein [Blastocystis hominis]CBK22566.2 unnamed protein product [Blastocystis hominis]|eukprot:XP_012896614.1 uncharacterized protein [Blastocystis hominis]